MVKGHYIKDCKGNSASAWEKVIKKKFALAWSAILIINLKLIVHQSVMSTSLSQAYTLRKFELLQQLVSWPDENGKASVY